MFSRLKSDFRLSIITLAGVCAALAITPFAVFRFLQGQMVTSLFEIGIVLGLLAAVVHGWVTGRTAASGFVMAAICSVGAIVVGQFIGEPGLLWLYPCLMSNYFMTSIRMALALNSVVIIALMFQLELHSSLLQMWVYFATAMLVSTCAWVFAYRNEIQKNALEHLATIDPLTGAGNRRYMGQQLAIAMALSERSGQPCSLVVIDLDNFKAVNDRYGHSTGDRVLVDLVGLIRQHTRRTDSLFRFGGEEFVLLLPGTSGAGLKTVISNLQAAVRKHLRVEGQLLTASFGAAEQNIGESVERWLERADEALYQAKEAGRDRVIYAGGPQVQSEEGATQADCLLT